MSAAATITVRNLTSDGQDNGFTESDMPSGVLTVQHILDHAGVDSSKASVMIDGRRVPPTATVDRNAQTELLVVPNVANG